MAHETNDGPRVGRILADVHASLAADYPTVLPATAMTALETWLDDRQPVAGDELRTLTATLAIASERLSRLAPTAITDADDEQALLAAVTLGVWAAGVAHTATMLHDMAAARFAVTDPYAWTAAASDGGQRVATLLRPDQHRYLRDALDLLGGPAAGNPPTT